MAQGLLVSVWRSRGPDDLAHRVMTGVLLLDDLDRHARREPLFATGDVLRAVDADGHTHEVTIGYVSY